MVSINHLVFLYDIACYTFGGFGLLFAAFTAAVHRNAIDGRYAAFMTGLAVIIVMDTVSVYARNAEMRGDVFFALLPCIETAGGSLIIAFLPRFIHSFSAVPVKRILDLAFLLIAAFSLALGISWTFGARAVFPRGTFRYEDSIIILAVILYCVLAGRIYGKRWPLSGVTQEESARWNRIMGLVTVLTVSFIPFFIFVDFFPEILPALSGLLPGDFRTYPFFFLLWNLIYVIHTAPTYGRSDAKRGRWRFERFDLSPREREVASLLLEGMSYRGIAEKLFLSFATVKTYVNRIYEKTGAGNKMELSRMLGDSV